LILASFLDDSMPLLAASLRGLLPPAALARADLAFGLGFERLVLDGPLWAGTWDALRAHLPRESVFALRVFEPRPVTMRPGSSAPFEILLGELSAAEIDRQIAVTLAAADSIGSRCVLLPVLRGLSPRKASSMETSRGAGRGASRESKAPDERDKIFDRYRRLVDSVASQAGRYGIEIAMHTTGRWRESPDPVEVQRCLEDFDGAPIVLWLDAIRLPFSAFVERAAPIRDPRDRRGSRRSQRAAPELGEAETLAPTVAALDPDALSHRTRGLVLHDTRGDSEGLVPGDGTTEWESVAPIARSVPLVCLDLDPRLDDDAWRRGREAIERIVPEAPKPSPTGSRFLEP
jgi:hypothetical protein